MSNKEFVGWVAVKDVEGRNGNPNWQYTQISFKHDDFDKMKNFINDKGYVNLKLNRSQKGKEYLEIDTFGLNKTSPMDRTNSMPPIEQGPMDAVAPNPAPATPPPMSFTNENDDEVPF